MFGKLKSSHAQNTQGIGLGLKICKKIAGVFGGDIYCESEGLNKGSKFSFSFQVSDQQFQPDENSDIDTEIAIPQT